MNSKERKRLSRLNATISKQERRIDHLEDRRLQLMLERDEAQKRVRQLEGYVGTLSPRNGAPSPILQYTVAIDEMHLRNMAPSDRMQFARYTIERMVSQLNEKYPPYDTWIRRRAQ